VIVRELITKLGFHVDEAQARRYDRLAMQTGKKVMDVGRRLSMSITLPLTIMGGAILGVAGSFEQAMNRVQVITGATTAEFELLREQAAELGATTQFSASEAAQAMGFLAQAGFSAEQIYRSMPATLFLAGASMQDLATTADQLSNIMTQFNIPAGDAARVSDTLAATASSSNTSITQLAQAMSFTGGVANDLGVSIEQASALIGIMGNAGIQSTRAGRGLRMALLRLLDPASDAEQALSRLNVPLSDASGDVRNFVDILADLRRAEASVRDLEAIFGTEAVSGISAVINQSEESFNSFVDALERAGGTAARQSQTQMRGFYGSLKELRSALEAVAIAIGDSGILEFFTGLAKGVARVTRDLSRANPVFLRIAFAIGAIVAAIPPLLIGIGAVTWAIGALEAVSWPVVLVIMAIVAAIIALVLIIEDLYTWITGGNSLIGSWIGPFDELVDRITLALRIAWIVIRDGFIGAWEAVRDFTITVWETIVDGIKGAIDTIVWAFNSAVDWIRDLWNGLVDTIVGFWENTIKPIVDAIAGVFNSAMDFVTGTVDVSGGNFIGNPYDVATAAADATGIAGVRNVDVQSTINLTLPDGTPDYQVQIVRGAAEEAVGQELRRQLRRAIAENPEVE